MNQLDMSNSMMGGGIGGVMPQMPLAPQQHQHQQQQQQQQPQYYQTLQQPQQVNQMHQMQGNTPSPSPSPAALSGNQMPPTAYMNNLLANSISTTTAAAANNRGQTGGFDVMGMTYDGFKSERDCRSEQRFVELAQDFSKIAKLTMMDDGDYMYTLLRRSAACDNKEFCCSVFSQLYREKYPELFERYDSLKVFLEYCLTVIIYSSEAHLRNACITNTVRLPDNSGLNGLSKLIRVKRRSPMAQNDNAVAEPQTKRRKAVEHPLKKTIIYKSKQILFEIGKCVEYCIPAQFACLSFTSTQMTLNKRERLTTTPYAGLKLTFNKPVLCLLNTRTCKSYTFVDLEHLSDLGTVLTTMTGMSMSASPFALGTKSNMTTISITTGQTVDKSMTDHNMVLIQNISVFQLTNHSLSGKAYADTVYRLEANSAVQPSVLKNCEDLIEQYHENIELLMEQYDIECGIDEVDGGGGDDATTADGGGNGNGAAADDGKASTSCKNDKVSTVNTLQNVKTEQGEKINNGTTADDGAANDGHGGNSTPSNDDDDDDDDGGNNSAANDKKHNGITNST